MATASEPPGNQDRKSGTGGSNTPPEPKGAARRGKAADRRNTSASVKKDAEAKSPRSNDEAASDAKASSTGTGTDSTAGSAGAAATGNGDASAPGDNGSWPWERFALYGLAGVIGGLIVGGVLLLTGGSQGLRGEVQALQAQVEGLGSGAGDPQQVATLRRRIEALDTRLETLADRAGSTEGGGALSGAGGQDLRTQLDQINEELVRLDTKLAGVAGELRRTETRLSARVESLEAVTPDDLPALLDKMAERETVEALLNRVMRLEQDEMNSNVRSAALALSLANLMRAADTSQSFVNELKALQALQPDNGALDALERHARSGLPSVSALTGRFDKVADDVVSAWRKAHGKGVLDRLWDSIIGLFRVRPVGEAEGMATPALVARAEQRLANGDLHLAVEELSKLGDPEKAAAEEWLSAARARLELDRLVSEVNRKVLVEVATAQAARRAYRENADPSAQGAGTAPSPGPAKAERATPDAKAAPDADDNDMDTSGRQDATASGAPER